MHGLDEKPVHGDGHQRHGDDDSAEGDQSDEHSQYVQGLHELELTHTGEYIEVVGNPSSLKSPVGAVEIRLVNLPVGGPHLERDE